MKCKIFKSANGYLNAGLGKTPVILEDVVNDFLKKNKIKKVFQIVQSQCVTLDNDIAATLTIFY